MALGWNSPSIPKLLSEDSHIYITADDSSWIASLLEIGSVISAIPAVWSMDRYKRSNNLYNLIILKDLFRRFGRKKTFTFGIIPIIIAWILKATATIVELIFVARILCGFTFGVCLCVMPMYLGEIASPIIRGSLAIILTLMSKSGVLLAYSIGPFVSFQALAYISLTPCILFLIATLWLPETPYFLLGKNRSEEALVSLKKLRGHENVHNELERMSLAVQKSKDNTGKFNDLFHTRGNRRALIILIGLASIQMLCGSQAVLAYSQTIFKTIDTANNFNPSIISIILASVQLATVILCTLTVDRVGRRPLLLLSITGTTICNIIVGLYFFLDLTMDTTTFAWLPIATIMVFIFCYNIGLPTVNLAILGEIFPTNLKAIAGLTYTIWTALLSFTVSKLFQVVSDGLGSHVTFWGFAVFGLIFIPFAWLLIPETKGKPFDVILQEFNAKKK